MLLLLSLALSLTMPTQLAAGGDEAKRLAAEGQLDRARDRYEEVLRSAPNDAAAQEGMASASERLALNERAAGHMDGALAILLRARRAEPDDKRVLLDLGILEDEMMLDHDAAETLEHLESLKPDDPNVWYAFARVDLNLGRLEAAEREMRRYLDARPEDASAHYGMGRIYLQGLQFDKAKSELERSISLQPKQSEAYYELGQADLDENEFEEAIRQFQKTLERDPRHGGALAGTGTAYFKLKQYAAAKAWLERAIQAAPEYQPGHYYLGLTLGRLGEAEASRRELKIATELAEKDSKAAATRLRLNGPDGQP
jgi:tetratricopeptide (TPR) repeat protein